MWNIIGMAGYFALCAFIGWELADWYIRRQQQRALTVYCKKWLNELQRERIEYEKEKLVWEDGNYVLGRAGEDINAGDIVTIEDGLCKKSKQQ